MAQRFCSSCGNALDENEAFCGSCGTPNPIQQAAPAPAPAPVPQQAVPSAAPQQTYVDNGAVPRTDGAAAVKGGGKKVVVIAAVAVVLIAAIVVAVIVISNLTGYQKIDAKELVRVEFTGMDGQGVAKAYLNTDHKEYDEKKDKKVTVKGSDFLVQDDDDDYKDRLLGAYTKAKKKSDAQDMQEVLMEMDDDGELINLTFELSDEKKLKNGDKITVTVDFDEDELKEAKIKLENTEFELEVKGLKTVEEIDLFQYVDVSFDGYNGDGNFEVITKDLPTSLEGMVSFGKYDYYDDLSNGDKVKVAAYVYPNYYDDDDNPYIYDKDADKYYDYKSKSGDELTKEFEVSGLKELAEFDPMVDAKVEFSGVGPYEISRVNKDAMTPEIADAISFNYEWNTEYNIGDTVTVKAYAYSDLKNLGYKLTGNEDSDGYHVYTFTLTEDMVPVLVTDVDTAKTVNEATEAMFADNLADIKDDLDSNSSIKKATDLELTKTYLVVAKDTSGWGAKTILARIYKTTITNDDKSKEDRYYMLYASDLVKENGEVKCTNDYVSTSYYTSKIKDFDDYWNKDDYTRTEIK